MQNKLQKTDIFKLCSTFDKKEAVKCSIFLSEFTDATNKCVLLYNEILHHYKKAKFCWKNVKVSIATINKKLFGNPEDTSTSRVLRSKLYKNVTQYCIFLDFQKQKNNSENTFFLDYLADKKEDDLFFKELNRIEKNITIKKKIDTNSKPDYKIGIDYVNLNHLSYKAFLELTLRDQSKKNKIDYNIHYQNFSHYSILQKIQNYCLILNHHLIEKQERDIKIEAEAKLLFQTAQKIPEIQAIAEIYETASLMLKNDRSQYIKLKELLFNTEMNISKKDKQFLYDFMHNFCIGSNNPPLTNEFRINLLRRFDEGLLHDGEYLKLMNAKKLCSTILNLTRSSDETIKMTKVEAKLKIKEVVKEMPPKHRESTEYFHLAILDFYFKDYKSAAKKLKKSPKYANAFFNFDARTVLQRCFYYLEDVEDFDKSIRNFHLALNNDHDLSKLHKNEYSNFTKAIQILQNAKLLHDKNDKKKQLERLETFLQEHPVKVLNWFNEQIQEMQPSLRQPKG